MALAAITQRCESRGGGPTSSGRPSRRRTAGPRPSCARRSRQTGQAHAAVGVAEHARSARTAMHVGAHISEESRCCYLWPQGRRALDGCAGIMCGRSKLPRAHTHARGCATDTHARARTHARAHARTRARTRAHARTMQALLWPNRIESIETFRSSIVPSACDSSTRQYLRARPVTVRPPARTSCPKCGTPSTRGP